MMPAPCRRASALLLALALLAVLAVVIASFARLAALESDAATSRVDTVRARFLAAAGLEQAMAQLGRGPHRPWDGPDSPWFYRGHAGRASGNGVPVEEATEISFAAGTAPWGADYSGTLPETYEPYGDTFRLRVLDAASMIDLNTPRDPRRVDADQPLVRMLENLSSAIDPANPPITRDEAIMILAWRATRPEARYDDARDLLAVPGRPVTESEFEAIRDFVTARAWADTTVVSPTAPALVPALGTPVYGRTPTGAPLRISRRPVDVNTAPLEVLVAVFAGVTAAYVEEGTDDVAPGDPLWTAVGRSARTRPVGLDQARALAAGVTDAREVRPFTTWAEFRDFLDARVAAGTIDAMQAWALLAQADPNTDTHRVNPDANLHRPIDKFDLVASTTELSFGSMGIFEIESMGCLTHEGGRIRAQATIRAVVEAYSIVRETSQAQFVRGAISTRRLAEPVYYWPDRAAVVEEDLRIDGNPRIRGEDASVHSNRDLSLIGTPDVEGDATASGRISVGSSATVGGACQGGCPPIPIPVLRPSDFRNSADVIFGADGIARSGSGGVLGDGSYGGWTFKKGTWKWNGGTQLDGVLYFEGDADMGGNTTGTWKATFVATGSISIQGTPVLAPATGQSIALLAGTDIAIMGNPNSVISGLLYAGEQFELGGNTRFRGPLVARGLGSADGLVRTNRIHGDVLIDTSGTYGPIIVDWTYYDVPSLHLLPEPATTVSIGGQDVYLPSVADYDGWISLSTIDTPRVLLGPQPHHDRLLASWERGTLDADLAGGSPALAPDRAGPSVAAVVRDAAPGHLLPDGAYSEIDATPAYGASGNVGPLKGTIAFWVKPSWTSAAGATRRSHHLLALSRSEPAGTQSFQLARAGSWRAPWSWRTGFHFERSAIENAAAERLVYSTWTPPAHRWTHVAIAWDFLTTSGGIAFYVDGVEVPGAIHDGTGPYELTELELPHAAITPGNLLRLGERAGSDYDLSATGADATFDELVSLPSVEGAGWAASIHLAGRYHNAGSARYDSAELPIPGGSRLLWASWTLRREAGDPSPATRFQVLSGTDVVLDETDPAGDAIGVDTAGTVRYRIVFQSDAPGVPLYTSPAVDDVTIAFSRQARILSWEER